MRIHDFQGLKQWSHELADTRCSDFAESLALELLQRAKGMGITYGDDWASVVDMPPRDWHALNSRVLAGVERYQAACDDLDAEI